MVRKLQIILFIYSLSVCLFFTVSGFFGSKNPGLLAMQVIFLPVTGYFVVSGVKLLKGDKNVLPVVDFSQKKAKLTMAIRILILLSIISITKLFTK